MPMDLSILDHDTTGRAHAFDKALSTIPSGLSEPLETVLHRAKMIADFILTGEVPSPPAKVEDGQSVSAISALPE